MMMLSVFIKYVLQILAPLHRDYDKPGSSSDADNLLDASSPGCVEGGEPRCRIKPTPSQQQPQQH